MRRANISGAVSATPATAPSTPPACSASQVPGPGSHAVSVQWSTPSYDGGAPIEFYLIHVDHYGTQVLADSVSAPSASTFVTLDFGSNYDVSVAAYNAAGTGGWCHTSTLNVYP